MTRNIFIEGIPGSGKSTLLMALAERFSDCRAYREGDVSPVELAWCSYMTPDEFIAARGRFAELSAELDARAVNENGRVIVPYTHIKTENRDFYAYMERFELYGGRRSAETFRETVLARFGRFRSAGNIFECSFFQNIVEELMLYELLDHAAVRDFYRELIGTLDLEAFRLVRLVPEDVAANVGRIKRERVDNDGNEVWYAAMLDYLRSSPSAKKYGYETFEDVVAHFKRRIALENELLTLLPEKCVINIAGYGNDIDGIARLIEA